MARPLRVAQVRLDGTAIPHIWDFPQGVTVIVGAVGGGKTSLLNLIKFGLGGDAPITAEILDAADSVTLDVFVGERRLRLTRGFSENVVLGGTDDEPQRRYALRRGAKDPWLSDLLLESLGIPSVRVRQSRTGRSHRLTSISFQDIFAYCYLDQEQVDRSTVYDDDRFRGPKRQWTFELLHGIIDGEIAELEAAVETLRAEAENREKRVATVEAFARDRGLPLVSQAIDARLAEIGEEEASAVQALEAARRDAEQAAGLTSEAHVAATRIEEQLALARAGHRRTSFELEGVRRAANQLQRDLVAHREGTAARNALEPLPYVVCPRCEQALDPGRHRAGHCIVCLQLDPPAGDGDTGALMRRLSEQLEETRALEGELSAAETEAGLAVSEVTTALRERRQEIRRIVAAAAAPHLERVAELREKLGALRGERLALTETRPVTAAVLVERAELREAEPEIADLEARAIERRDQLTPARERIEDLSEAFSEILHRFTLPWLTSAEVDRQTYLPRVNQRSLRDLSSGGMKATTNVAYYLAVLVIALRDRAVLTPSFLIGPLPGGALTG